MIEDITPVAGANAAPPVERQYEDLASAVRGIVWEADGETMRFTFVSDKAEEVLGYPARRWVDEATFWLDHLHPEDRDRSMQVCIDAARERSDRELEYRMLADDGNYLWLRETVTVDLDPAGRVRLRGVIVDISRQKAIEEELIRRDAILEAVRFAGERLLATSGAWGEGVQDVLERLGRATGVSRVYIFENYTAPDGETWATNTHEWVSSPELSVIDLPHLQEMSYTDIGFGRWVELFRRGEMLYSHARDLPAVERRELEAEGTLSIALVPIIIGDEWWGFIGFDECEHERSSSAMERDALKAAADTLGAAIGRSRADQELRESQRSMQTLLANLPGMAYRSRPGMPWQVDFVSEGALELTGYPPSRLVGDGDDSYLSLIHPDDRAALRREIELATATGDPFHLNYRIVTADGAEKWVMEQGRAIHDETGAFERLEGIITDVTDRIQARHLLQQRVEERTRELATLLEIARNMTATLELEPLLGMILDELKAAVDYHGAGILILQEGELVQVSRRGPGPRRTDDDIRVRRAESEQIRTMIERGTPQVIGDVWGDDPAAAAYRKSVTEAWLRERPYIRSWAAVPLQARNRTLGLLVVSYSEPDFFTERHVELLTAVAAQAAVAIENARLFEEAQGTAALEERQRLARELHDSVSQALFGIGLGARTARTLLDTDPAKAVAPVEYVLSLAEAGLAEMRALIFELRPEALEQEGLVAALEKQAAATRARYGIAVEAVLPAMIEAPQPVQEAIYRIAQEALHNIVKHARATTVRVEAGSEGGATTLWIADDGVGFEPGGTFPGHLGLRSMAERAEKLGGTLAIESAPGAGTTVRVSIPNPGA